MATLAIVHRVKDFEAWKRGYDDHEPARKEAGAQSARVFREEQDPNAIVVVLDFGTREEAETFANDPGLHDAMRKAGVISTPTFCYAGGQ